MRRRVCSGRAMSLGPEHRLCSSSASASLKAVRGCGRRRAAGEMPTAFESKVHAVVRGVPAGKVTTYGAVAAVAGGCARSVGAVMSKNCPAETCVQ